MAPPNSGPRGPGSGIGFEQFSLDEASPSVFSFERRFGLVFSFQLSTLVARLALLILSARAGL